MRELWWELRAMFRETICEGPEYLAWRIDAWVVRVNDQKLSQLVQDAMPGGLWDRSATYHGHKR